MVDNETMGAGPLNPDDIRQPGAGGGEQPATFLLTNDPVGAQGSRTGFEAGEAEPIPVFEVGPGLADETERTVFDFEEETIADKLAYARGRLGDDVFVLEEGSEVFNAAGLRVILKTPTVIKLDNGSPDAAVNDQRFASFLFGSDRNWELNIKQLGRPFDRARNVALPLVCEAHGEDLEWEPYGRPKQCPKCAEAALLAAAEVQPAQPEAVGNIDNPPETSIEPIKVGDLVVLNVDEPVASLQVMTVLSIEFGIANCQWINGDGVTQERTYGVAVLRRVRPGFEIPAVQE